jgi:hypothetical protein
MRFRLCYNRRGWGTRANQAEEGYIMDANELVYAKGVLLRLAQAARSDFALAEQVRELILQTGILDIFGQGDGLNPFDMLDAGGDALLRSRLGTLSLAQLKQIVVARGLDPEKTSGRWRSPARFVDLIVARAVEQWQQLSLARIAAAPTMRMATPSAPFGPDAAAPTPEAEPEADAQLNKIASAAAWML